MSNREKNLLYLLLVICTLAGGFKLFIEPQMTVAADQDIRYEALTQEKEVLDAAYEEAKKITGNYEDDLVALDALKAGIRDYQQDETLDDEMTALIKECDLDVEVLQIKQETSEYLPEDLEAVTAKVVKMSVYGDLEEFIKLEEALYQNTDVVISDIVIATEETTVNQYKIRYGTVVDGVMHITVVVYMKAEE